MNKALKIYKKSFTIGHVVHFLPIYLFWLTLIIPLLIVRMIILTERENHSRETAIYIIEKIAILDDILIKYATIELLDLLSYSLYAFVGASLVCLAIDCVKNKKEDVIQWAVYIVPCIVIHTNPDLLFFPLSLLP